VGHTAELVSLGTPTFRKALPKKTHDRQDWAELAVTPRSDFVEQSSKGLHGVPQHELLKPGRRQHAALVLRSEEV
jgi:hypothetical protein